jgi:hypothetical protein
MLYRIIEPYRRGDLGLDSKAKEKRSQAVQKVLVVVQSTSVLSNYALQLTARAGGVISWRPVVSSAQFANLRAGGRRGRS